MIWIWFFSSQHIGVPPAPVAGVPFYLHAHTAVIAPHDVTGNVLMTIDQDAGGLPLRWPSAATPMRCSLSQFDPVQSTTPIPCPDVSLASGSYVVSSLEALVPGFALDIEFPVVVDGPTSGTAAMTAMWATTDVGLSNNNVLATVPVTVAANPNPPTNPTANPTNPRPDGHQETTVEAAEGEEGSLDNAEGLQGSQIHGRLQEEGGVQTRRQEARAHREGEGAVLNRRGSLASLRRSTIEVAGVPLVAAPLRPDSARPEQGWVHVSQVSNRRGKHHPAVLIPAPGALASDDYRAVDPESGRIASFTYWGVQGNWYHTGGYFPTVWPYSVQQLGAGPNPTAGVPFYLHARSRVILDPNERVAATVQFAIDQNAGGLTLRYAPSATMPMQCSRTQYRLPEAPVEIACPRSASRTASSSSAKAEPLDPNYSLDVLFPVVVDKAASGTAAMTARWVTGDVTLSVENVELTVR